MAAFRDEKIAITLFNLHDLIIIRNNVVPQEDINLLMECTNTQDTQQATILNDDPDGKQDLEVRDTLWYPQSDELRVHLEQAISGCYFRYVQPRYQCTFKKYEPAQFLGYNPGGHYKKHNDGEHFNYETRQWERLMDRDVSFLFYLNENDGDTYFPRHHINIHPKAGSVLVFPPTWEYPHVGSPPTVQKKYIMSTYLHYG